MTLIRTNAAILLIIVPMADATAQIEASAESRSAAPIFKNSVVSNDIDFIRVDDPTESFEIRDACRGRRAIPGRID